MKSLLINSGIVLAGLALFGIIMVVLWWGAKVDDRRYDKEAKHMRALMFKANNICPTGALSFDKHGSGDSKSYIIVACRDGTVKVVS